MRHLIHELPFETPLRAGRFRYEREGRPTGAVESWRLTAAPDGYRFLRVDLDAREAASGHSYLYHATLDEAGRVQQVKFRFWGGAREIAGTVLRDGDAWTCTRAVDGDRHEEETPGHRWFWFPSCAGLGLLPLGDVGGAPACTLDTRSLGPTAGPADAAFALREVVASLRRGENATLTVAGAPVAVRAWRLRWAWPDGTEAERTLWLDDDGWPLQMRRGDGLAAVETQNIRWAGGPGRAAAARTHEET